MALRNPQQPRVWSRPQRAACHFHASLSASNVRLFHSTHNVPGQQHGSRTGPSPASVCMQQGLHRLSRLVCRASRASDDPVRKQLPIFPLGVVAMPHAVVPLMIFEARYRVLFNTLLAGSEKVDEGLVQQESPFAGSRRFGMCYVDERGRLSAIGTTLEIQDFVLEPNGRMYVTNKGVERFEVKSVVTEKPVLVCEVEVLPEDQDESEEATKLSSEVADLFRNVLRLHLKMNRNRSLSRRSSSSSSSTSEGLGSEAEDESLEAAELTESNPQQLSYWIAHAFTDSKYTQQALLEENKTMVRLGAEKDLLAATLKYYTAATALEGVFSSTGSTSSASGEVQPPPGGPD
eukprot:GHUV01005489.1.p1 GENE.GHUV01005489.1~~GHUV01005489.1.p1  ORF type:complete len:347 (+),score=73.03 GHUV01005489.1:210-1250(+)